MGIEFEDYSIKVKKLVEDKALELLHDAGNEITKQAADNTKSNKGSGELRKSWKFVVDKSSMSVKIGSPLEHSIYQELGTGEWALNGDGRKGNWYVPIGNEKNQMPKEVAEKYGFRIVHGKNGIEFAEVHGQRPVRPLHNAMETSKSKIIRRAKTLFGG